MPWLKTNVQAVMNIPSNNGPDYENGKYIDGKISYNLIGAAPGHQGLVFWDKPTTSSNPRSDEIQGSFANNKYKNNFFNISQTSVNHPPKQSKKKKRKSKFRNCSFNKEFSQTNQMETTSAGKFCKSLNYCELSNNSRKMSKKKRKRKRSLTHFNNVTGSESSLPNKKLKTALYDDILPKKLGDSKIVNTFDSSACIESHSAGLNSISERNDSDLFFIDISGNKCSSPIDSTFHRSFNGNLHHKSKCKEVKEKGIYQFQENLNNDSSEMFVDIRDSDCELTVNDYLYNKKKKRTIQHEMPNVVDKSDCNIEIKVNNTMKKPVVNETPDSDDMNEFCLEEKIKQKKKCKDEEPNIDKDKSSFIKEPKKKKKNNLSEKQSNVTDVNKMPSVIDENISFLNEELDKKKKPIKKQILEVVNESCMEKKVKTKKERDIHSNATVEISDKASTSSESAKKKNDLTHVQNDDIFNLAKKPKLNGKHNQMYVHKESDFEDNPKKNSSIEMFVDIRDSDCEITVNAYLHSKIRKKTIRDETLNVEDKSDCSVEKKAKKKNKKPVRNENPDSDDMNESCLEKKKKFKDKTLNIDDEDKSYLTNESKKKKKKILNEKESNVSETPTIDNENISSLSEKLKRNKSYVKEQIPDVEVVNESYIKKKVKKKKERDIKATVEISDEATTSSESSKKKKETKNDMIDVHNDSVFNLAKKLKIKDKHNKIYVDIRESDCEMSTLHFKSKKKKKKRFSIETVSSAETEDHINISDTSNTVQDSGKETESIDKIDLISSPELFSKKHKKKSKEHIDIVYITADDFGSLNSFEETDKSEIIIKHKKKQKRKNSVIDNESFDKSDENVMSLMNENVKNDLMDLQRTKTFNEDIKNSIDRLEDKDLLLVNPKKKKKKCKDKHSAENVTERIHLAENEDDKFKSLEIEDNNSTNTFNNSKLNDTLEENYVKKSKITSDKKIKESSKTENFENDVSSKHKIKKEKGLDLINESHVEIVCDNQKNKVEEEHYNDDSNTNLLVSLDSDSFTDRKHKKKKIKLENVLKEELVKLENKTEVDIIEHSVTLDEENFPEEKLSKIEISSCKGGHLEKDISPKNKTKVKRSLNSVDTNLEEVLYDNQENKNKVPRTDILDNDSSVIKKPKKKKMFDCSYKKECKEFENNSEIDITDHNVSLEAENFSDETLSKMHEKKLKNTVLTAHKPKSEKFEQNANTFEDSKAVGKNLENGDFYNDTLEIKQNNKNMNNTEINVLDTFGSLQKTDSICVKQKKKKRRYENVPEEKCDHENNIQDMNIENKTSMSNRNLSTKDLIEEKLKLLFFETNNSENMESNLVLPSSRNSIENKPNKVEQNVNVLEKISTDANKYIEDFADCLLDNTNESSSKENDVHSSDKIKDVASTSIKNKRKHNILGSNHEENIKNKEYKNDERLINQQELNNNTDLNVSNEETYTSKSEILNNSLVGVSNKPKMKIHLNCFKQIGKNVFHDHTLCKGPVINCNVENNNEETPDIVNLHINQPDIMPQVCDNEKIVRDFNEDIISGDVSEDEDHCEEMLNEDDQESGDEILNKSKRETKLKIKKNLQTLRKVRMNKRKEEGFNIKDVSSKIRQKSLFREYYEKAHDLGDNSEENSLILDKIKEQPSEDDIDKIIKMNIDLDIDVPLLHSSVGRMSTVTPKEMANIKSLNLKIKSGPFSKEEDEKIIKNFERFTEEYDLPSIPSLYCKFPKRVKPAEKLKFVRFISQGLEERYIHSVYARFKTIFTNAGLKLGRFSPSEDEQILECVQTEETKLPFQYLSKVLNRPRNAIINRYIKLSRINNSKIDWTPHMIEKLLRKMQRVTRCEKISDLKDRKLVAAEWEKLSRRMNNIPVVKLKRAWNVTVYPRLFAKTTDLKFVKEEIIDVLIERNESDWRKVCWTEVARNFEGFTAEKLYMMFRHVVWTHVPDKYSHDLSACLFFLKNKFLKYSKLSNLRGLKKLVYKNDKLMYRDKVDSD